MRTASLGLLILTIAACGGSGDGPGDNGQTGACSLNGQKQFVLDEMRNWYLWNDLLPASVDIDNFATPEALLASLTSVQPLDRFSFINSAAADQQFFNEGEFEGYGFSYRVVGGNSMFLERVFADGPAGSAGLARGQQVLEVNGQTVASIIGSSGVAGLDALFDAATVEFLVERPDTTQFSAPMSRGLVTIDPVPQHRVIDAGGGRTVGYLELVTFIGTAEPQLATVFGEFEAAGVTDVVIDLRYNGGGLVRTAELLGDFLGGFVAVGQVFSRTQFNADRAAANDSTELFADAGPDVALSRLAVVATRGTASASELVINGMAPWVEVTIVGETTFGKPVGQLGLEFCDKILRPTSFRKANALDEGNFFDGLPVDCPAPDDIGFAIGADDDPNLVTALTYLDTGACPQPQSAGNQKPQRDNRQRLPDGRPWRDLLDAR